MPSRADVIAEARRWLLTRWQHQARRRGLATDCGGLIGGVAVELGLLPARWWADVFDPRFGGYSRQPSRDRLRQILLLYMDRIEAADAAQPGDVALMRFGRAEPHHLGIIGDHPIAGRASLIHALGPGSPCRVTEHILAPSWRERIVDAFQYRGLSA
jgi:cell wall-associated NlpC family hydrolase